MLGRCFAWSGVRGFCNALLRPARVIRYVRLSSPDGAIAVDLFLFGGRGQYSSMAAASFFRVIESAVDAGPFFQAAGKESSDVA